MEIMESIRAAIKELILPDLDRIREETKEIKAILTVTNKRLDDVNVHVVDQSRRIDETNKRIDDLREALSGRIDAVRADLTGRIDAVREDMTGRIDSLREDLTGRIDSLREDLTGRIDSLREDLTGRIDSLREDLTGRIDAVREDLTGRIDETNRFIIETNLRLDRLYEVVVRRDEHVSLTERVIHLERDLADIKQKLAA